MFQQICRTCGQYNTLLTALGQANDCSCYDFKYGACPHLTATDMLCDLFQICYDTSEYHGLYCDDKVSRVAFALRLSASFHRPHPPPPSTLTPTPNLSISQ